MLFWSHIAIELSKLAELSEHSIIFLSCLESLTWFLFLLVLPLQKLEEQDRKALNVKEQLQREHRYLKRRLEQLSVSGSMERVRTDSMGSTISTDSEQGWSPSATLYSREDFPFLLLLLLPPMGVKG